jgi:hypothetical protein
LFNPGNKKRVKMKEMIFMKSLRHSINMNNINQAFGKWYSQKPKLGNLGLVLNSTLGQGLKAQAV